MTSWLVKAGAQGAIALLPRRHDLNHLFQRYVTRSIALRDDGFDTKLAQCRRHLDSYAEHAAHAASTPKRVLELGTGWYPIAPVGLALAGAGEVVTIDVTPLLSPERVQRVLDLYAARLRDGRLSEQLPSVDEERASLLQGLGGEADPRELLGRIGIRTLVGDARACPLPAGSVDLFVSNNTFEHIPPATLSQILTEFRRLAAPGAVMSHFIDMSDHYAHFDRGITEFNYLRYPDRVWRLFNNELQYQSRLRVSDYRALIESAGFRIADESHERGDAGELARLRPARRFRRYATDDLLVLRSWTTAVATAQSPSLPATQPVSSAST